MGTFAARLSDLEYVNWLKVGFALNYLKEGLDDFVEAESKAFHAYIVTSTFGSAVPSVCDSCTVRDIKEDRRKKTWRVGCSYHTCDQILEKIVNHHLTKKNIPWSNCGDITKWPVNHWSVSKVYMNSGQVTSQGPEDCDCTNFLNLFANCKWYYSKLSTTLADYIRVHRNDLMHSTTMKVATADMQKWLTDMIKLLQSLSDFNNRPQAKSAVDFIVKTRDTDIEIMTSDEIHVLKQIQQGLEKTVTEQRDEMRQLKKTIEDMEASVSTMKDTDNEMQKTTKDHREDVELLKKKVETLQMSEKQLKKALQEIEQKQGSLQSPEKRHEEKLQELKQKLIEIYRQNCMEIPVSPLHTKKTIKIQKLYTDLIIVEEEQADGTDWNEKGFREERDGKDQQEEGSGKRREIPVKSYEDMLYKKGRRMKNVFVLGEAGTGKSTLAKKMAVDWVCAHTDDDEERTPDLKTMEQFSFLFYVPLRAVPICTSVFSAVCQSIAKYSGFEEAIKHLFETHSESVLVICDGLDEVKSVLDQQSLHDCTTITTTRPWKFDFVDQTLYHVDSVLELRGLNEEGAKYLIDKVLTVVYQDGSFKTEFALKRALGLGYSPSNKSELTILSKTPLLLVYLIHVWFEDGRCLPTSLTKILTKVLILTLRCGENRLSCMDDILAFRKLWRKVNVEDLFGGNKLLSSYGGLLKCVSSFALKTLTSPSKEHSLVFTDEEVEEYFNLDKTGGVDSNVQLEACVRLGLLTRTEYPSFLGDKYTLSFQHKAVHEYFAALSIAQDQDGVIQFVKYCKSVRVLLEMSNVFQFVCGLSPNTGSAVSKGLMKMFNVDPDILLWRGNVYERYWVWGSRPFKSRDKLPRSRKPELDIVRRLTSLYRYSIMTECKVQSSNEVLHIADCVPERQRITKNMIMSKQYLALVNSNLAELASLDLTTSALEDIHSQNSGALSDMKNLVKLRVEGNVPPNVDVLNVFLKAAGQLQMLQCNLHPWTKNRSKKGQVSNGVHNREVSNQHSKLSFSSLHNLRHLIWEFESYTPICHLQTMLTPGQLETLCLTCVSVEDSSLNFSSLLYLSELALKKVDMARSAWCGLLSSMGSCHAMKKLYMEDIKFGRDDICLPNTKMDLSGCTQLQEVHIEGVSIGDIQVDFSPLLQPSKLTLEKVDMTWSVWCGLLSSLVSCHLLKKTWYIENVILDREDTCISDTNKDLSGCTQLQKVHVERVSIHDVILDFSPPVQPSGLTLKKVDMTWSIWCGLLSLLGSCHTLETLDIQYIRIYDRNTCSSGTNLKMDLSGCTWLWKIDIVCGSSCTVSDTGFACNISRDDISWSSRYFPPLISSLSQVTSLRRLTLAYLDSDCVNILLGVLPYLCSLTRLELQHIDFDDQNLSLKHNSQLHTLTLTNVLFKSGVLDLTHNAYLECLYLENTVFVSEKSVLTAKAKVPKCDDSVTLHTREHSADIKCTRHEELKLTAEAKIVDHDDIITISTGELSADLQCTGQHEKSGLMAEAKKPGCDDSITHSTGELSAGIQCTGQQLGTCQLTTASEMKLRRLKLKSVTLSVNTLNKLICCCCSLCRLELEDFEINSRQNKEILSQKDANASVGLIEDKTISDSFDTNFKMDFSACTQLTKINIVHSYPCTVSDTGITCGGNSTDDGVSPSTESLSALLSSLPQVTCLTELTVHYLDTNCVNILLSVLPHLCNISKLKLKYIDFGGHKLSFGHHSQLQRLTLTSVLFKSGMLDLTHNANLKYLNLESTVFVSEISAGAKVLGCFDSTTLFKGELSADLKCTGEFEKPGPRNNTKSPDCDDHTTLNAKPLPADCLCIGEYVKSGLTAEAKIPNYDESNSYGAGELSADLQCTRQQSGTCQLTTASKMELRELTLKSLTLSVDTLNQLLGCAQRLYRLKLEDVTINNKQTVDSLNRKEAFAAVDMIEIPSHLEERKKVYSDSKIDYWEAAFGRY